MDAATIRLVRARAEGRCEYCRLPELRLGLRFHIEHIRPRQHRGSDDPENLAQACPECNLRKGPNLTAIDPQSDEIVPLFHPRLDVWAEHFRWNGLLIEGVSAAGRATEELLQLNSNDRLRVRELLRGLGRELD